MEHVVFRRIPRVEPNLIARAQACSVGDLVESMPAADAAAALMRGGIRSLVPGARTTGQAITAWNHPGDNMMIHPAAEVALRGDVLVLTSGSADDGPLWGDLIASYAIAKGIAGAVVDGAVRDTAFMLEQRFPLWAAHVSASHPLKSTPGAVNVPIVCGGVTVFPGDLIAGDPDGVLVIPIVAIEEIVAKAEARAARENSIREEISKGRSLYELLEYDLLLKKAGVRIVDESWSR